MQPVAMTVERVKTIADIARIAGVSKATVSRALNDSTLVSVETRDRVRAIAQQHGFEMNATARSLSRRETNVIALATYPYDPFGPNEQSPGFVPNDKLPDTFVLEVMSGLAAGLHARDYDLLVIQIAHRRHGLDLPLPGLGPRRRLRADGGDVQRQAPRGTGSPRRPLRGLGP